MATIINRPRDIGRGFPLPLGSHAFDGGVNFACFSRHASCVQLALFDHPTDAIPSRVFDFDPIYNRTGDIWHIWIREISHGQLYAYRVDGPYQPKDGHRFNINKLLLDPYATAISLLADWDFDKSSGYTSSLPEQDLFCSKIDNAGSMPKCIFTQDSFDWKDDYPIKLPWSQIVIYETHIRGFTIHPSSGVKHGGTYQGLIEKIPYLKKLGVTAVELMPVQEFNANEAAGIDPETGEQLGNYWGYNPVLFFAPKASYSSMCGLGEQKLEFKAMVLALHKAGIEVILDIVFNHTAEGNEKGPTLCFRGFDNTIFYLLGQDQRFYQNFTGTGNTFNANHPVVRDHILDALRYWVIEMHVDGFRFDEATVLNRTQHGYLLQNAPLLERIAEDPVLRNTKIIAEPWDAAGGFQIGNFSENRWATWNGIYRDDVRCFWRGDQGKLAAFAQRLCGSPDIFAKTGRGPQNSINFITCHDGFTLNDLVSYQKKHNEANGENNRDGADENFSENYGIEGITEDSVIKSIRKRQIKNFILTLLVSRGVPMILGGDEFRRTQKGNNNAYCQDNEISWFDWNYLEDYQENYRFIQGMITFRKAHPALSKEAFYTGSEIRWFNSQGKPLQWIDPKEKELACLIHENVQDKIYLLFNASAQGIDFNLPSHLKGLPWYWVIDTAKETPQDFFSRDKVAPLDLTRTHSYYLESYASAILLIRK